LFDLGEASVRRYIKQYNEGGLDNLQPGQSPGRNASIPLSQAEWEELLARRPSQFEALHTRARNWSQPLLQRYLYHYHQLEVGQGTISNTLKRQGISWKRAKKK
jgi:transposase